MSNAGRFASGVFRLLRRTLPAAQADDIIGDLAEHYERRTDWRRLWLAAEAAKLVWGLRARVGEPAPPSRAWIEICGSELRYAARAVVRSRGFAAVALISLALGVGLATAVFSVIDGVLLRPLPYGDSNAIVRMREVTPAGTLAGDAIQRSLLRVWERSSQTLEAIGPYAVDDARIAVDAETFVGVTVEVGDRFFDVLRTTPAQGRLLGTADADRGAPLTAVLSYAFWQRAFGGGTQPLGRSIRVGERTANVVGVLPKAFVFPSPEVAIFLPGRWRLPDAPAGVSRAFMGPALDVVARLRPGRSTAEVASEARALSAQQLKPDAQGAVHPPEFEIVRLQDDLAGRVRPALVMLVAAVACVLAIVCVNLSGLMLARATVRQREMAVRAALGASRWGLVRPMMFEGILLSMAGGVGALMLASGLVAILPLAPNLDPIIASQVRIDARVLAFALGLSAVVGVVIGVLPGLQTPASHAQVRLAASVSHMNLMPATAVRIEHVRSALVVVQVALAIVLAAAAVLLSRSLVSLLTVDLGFNPRHAVSVQLRLPPGGRTFDWRARFYETFLDTLTANRSIRAAGFTTSLPLQESFSQAAFEIDGVAIPDPAAAKAHREVVTPGYFAALGLPVTRGRGLTAEDAAAAERVLVVNDTFVARFLPDLDPLAQHVQVFGMWARIVGVVKSKRHDGARSKVRPEFYVPLAQSPPDMTAQSGAGLVIRTAGPPGDVLPFVRTSLRALQPAAAVEREAILDDQVWSSTAAPRFYAIVMGAFAALAVITALVGVFGTLSYIVQRRRVEIGVRRALGATDRQVLGLVLRKAVIFVVIATPIGLAGARIGVRLLSSVLFGVQPADPVTFAAVAIGVPLITLAGSILPARAAARIEPLDALREN